MIVAGFRLICSLETRWTRTGSSSTDVGTLALMRLAVVVIEIIRARADAWICVKWRIALSCVVGETRQAVTVSKSARLRERERE